jgi:hypothetical protein
VDEGKVTLVNIDRGGTGGAAMGGASAAAGASGSGGTCEIGLNQAGGTPVDLTACTVHGVRLSTGGSVPQTPPPGSCVLITSLYCPGESYSIDSGPCTGTCTCGGAAWHCTYDHPAADGTCMVDGCTKDDGTMVSVGFTWTLADRCTSCRCTKQGILCNGSACDMAQACRDLPNEYDAAVAAAARCDPASATPQCTQRVPAGVNCINLVPVDDATSADAVMQEFTELGCPSAPRICLPSASEGTHAACSTDGICGYAL